MNLEKIKSNMQLDEKPLNKEKVKGADPNRKMDSIEAHIPKKARKGWTDKHCSLCKEHGGLPLLTTPRSAGTEEAGSQA